MTATIATPPDIAARRAYLNPNDSALWRDLAQLSHRVAKRPVVLFFGRPSFSDNSKYLYLHAALQPRGYDVLWCTAQAALAQQLVAQGLPVHLLGEPMQASVDLLLHAAVAVFTVNPLESVGLAPALVASLAGARQLQLWHGISVKHLTLQLLPHLGAHSADLRRYWLSSRDLGAVLSPASAFDRYWRSVFGCRTLVRAGLPRNEVLLRPATELELIGAELPERSAQALASGRPAVLVVPTWQRSRGTWLGEPEFITRALRFARETASEVFIKAHPNLLGRVGLPEQAIDGLHFLDPGLDLYPWLRHFHALVTDYSSILFDYLLTGRPVLTLDLAPGEHQSYEPDWGLVPEGQFRIPFGPADFENRLAEALVADTGAQARAHYVQQLYECDPANACASLMKLVDDWVAQSQEADFQVLMPGAAA